MSKRKPTRGDHRRPSREAPPTPQGRPERPRPPPESGIWLFGTHAVAAALQNPARRCLRLVATTEGAQGLPAAPSLPPEIVERHALDRLLSPGTVHQGVALLAEPLPEPAIEDIVAGAAESALVVVLDQATDPRNVGACLRSAAAFGAAAVIMPERHAPHTTGVLAKAASGALETVPLVRVTNLARTLEYLKEGGFWCIGLDGGAAKTIAEADLSGRVALVFGAEGPGLRRLTREHCDHLVKIPIGPGIESLNLSTAAAIALYDAARRRA